MKLGEIIRNILSYCVFPTTRKIYGNIYSVDSFYNAECNNIRILQSHVN